MSDAAFKTAAYPAYTTAQLREMIVSETPNVGAAVRNKMRDELTRRAKRDAGDWSVMTDGERLRLGKQIVDAFKTEGR